MRWGYSYVPLRLAGQAPAEADGRVEVLVTKVLGAGAACEAGADVALGQPPEQLVMVIVDVVM